MAKTTIDASAVTLIAALLSGTFMLAAAIIPIVYDRFKKAKSIAAKERILTLVFTQTAAFLGLCGAILTGVLGLLALPALLAFIGFILIAVEFLRHYETNPSRLDVFLLVMWATYLCFMTVVALSAGPNHGVQRSRATSFGRSESVASFEVFGTQKRG